MTRKAYQTRKKGTPRRDRSQYPFYPNHILRGLMVVAAAAALVAFLSAAFPPSLDTVADPLMQPAPGTYALWYLKPVLAAEKLVPWPALLSSATFLLGCLFILLPVLDRTGRRRLRKRLLLAVPFLILVAWLILSALSGAGARG